MVYVGEFTEKDLKAGADKKAVARMMELSGQRYTKTQLVHKNGKPVAIKIWCCLACEL